MNLPFGIAAIVLTLLYLHEGVEHQRRSIDYPGAILLLAAVGPLMMALTQASAWGLGWVALLVAVSIAAFVLFTRQERRAPDPLMHMELWSDALIRWANVATLTAGILMIGVITFLPTFVQGVLRDSALAAGFALSMMTVGWPIASFVAGKLIVTQGVRRMVRLGGIAVVLGTLCIALLAPKGAVGGGAGSFVLGVGLGLLGTTCIVAIQTSVAWSRRGVATASNMLMRILGNALGAALFGGVLNFEMSRYLARTGLGARVSLDSIQDLLGQAAPSGAALPPDVLDALRVGLSHSLRVVFWGLVVLGVATLAASFLIPEMAPVDDAPDEDADRSTSPEPMMIGH
jgi:MFS family permease